MTTATDDLIWYWLDGDADDAMIAELEKLLATSDAARRRLVAATRLHAALTTGHAASPPRSVGILPWAMAAGLLAAVGLGLLLSTDPDDTPAPRTAIHRQMTVHIEHPDHPILRQRITHPHTARDHLVRLGSP